MPPKRMTANPVKPARYRAGKALGPEDSSDSEDSEAEASNEPTARAIPPPPKATSAGKIITSGASLGKVDLAQRRREAEAKEAARVAKQKAEQQVAEEGFVTEEEEEGEEGDDDEEESDGDDESGDDEESSEDEAAQNRRQLMLRPKFIPKNQRAAATGTSYSATGRSTQDEEARFAAEEARRKADADALVEEQIKKDLARRAAGKKHWAQDDDHAGGSDAASDVDTTDDLDPEAEEAAWRLRELKRVKRERDRLAAQEAEIAERERRDALTQEERDAEDADKIAKQQEEKASKGRMGYLQKYYHKGAFYGDEAREAGLDQRDLMGARIADDVRDRSALPEYLQRRDMTQLGCKGGTKYKDLKTEDTGRWGEFRDHRPGRGDDDDFRRRIGDDVDERFRPDADRRGGFGDRGDAGAKGANAIPLGERKADMGGDSGRRRGGSRDRGGVSYRPRDSRDDDGTERRRRLRSMTRSRSRSPRHRPRRDYSEEGEGRERRKRSPSREQGRRDYESDKRRRVDAR